MGSERVSELILGSRFYAANLQAGLSMRYASSGVRGLRSLPGSDFKLE